MPGKDNPKTEEQVYQPSEHTQTSDMRSLLNTLDRVFSTFRDRLQTEAPNHFSQNAQIAVDTFNDIVAGLKFESSNIVDIAPTTAGMKNKETRNV